MRFALNAKSYWKFGTGLTCTNYSSTQEFKVYIPYGYRNPLTYSLVSVQRSRKRPSSDILRFPGSSTRKALDLEASNGLVCKFKAQDVFRNKCYL